MTDDDDPLPLARVQARNALHRAELQLDGHRDLRAEIRQVRIAHYIQALLEFGVTEPAQEREQEPIKNLEQAVAEAAERFGVSDSTAWRAWERSATHLNDPGSRRIVAKPEIRDGDRPKGSD